LPDQIRRFRFRPRFKTLAWGVVVLGLILLGVGLFVASSSSVPVGVGAAGVALGLLYLGSPAWRITVHVDDEALEVRSGRARKFRLLWEDVVEVVASPGTGTCFVDGGEPATSLLVPGPGASAPYDIENKAELYAIICARVPEERIRIVTMLDQAEPRGRGGVVGKAGAGVAGAEAGVAEAEASVAGAEASVAEAEASVAEAEAGVAEAEAGVAEADASVASDDASVAGDDASPDASPAGLVTEPAKDTDA
jgi:hypothetical protein